MGGPQGLLTRAEMGGGIRYAGHELRASDQQPDHRLSVQVAALARGSHHPRHPRPPRGRLEPAARPAVAKSSGWTTIGRALALPRAHRPTGPQDRLRDHLDLRRDSPGAGIDAARHDDTGHRTDRRNLTGLGAASRERRGDDLEQPPDHSACLGSLDSGRARRLAARRAARQLVSFSGSRERHFGESSSGSLARVSGASSPLA